MKSFKDFTNLYSLSKTLRLELKPTLETEAILKKLGVWCAKDEKKAKEKTVVKFYMDILHREFTEEALKRISLDLEKFFELFWEFKQIQNQSSPTKEVKKFKENNIKDKRNELKNEFKKLAIKFKEAFDETDQNWRDKYKDLGKTIKNEKSKSYLILSENVLNYLKNRFSQEEVEELREQDKKHLEEYQDVVNSDGENIFDNFKGFFGYFDSLIDNRGNFYKTDEKAARISTRAINENLSFFAENIYTFKTYFTDTLLEEITEKEKETFEENFYNKCLLQEGIKNYNLVIGDINKKLNKYNQQNDKKIPSLKTLYKQTLSLEENEDYKHIEIKNDNDFITVVEEFIEINSEKTLAGKKIFNSFITRCLSRNNLDQIYLPKDSVNTIAYRVFKPIEEIMQLFKNKYFVPLQEIEVLTKSNEWQKMLKESEEKEKHLIFKDSVSKSISPTNDIFANFIRILEEEYKKQFIGFEKETRRGQTKFVGYNEALNNLKGKLEWFKDKKARNQKLSNDEKIEIKKDRHPYHLKRYSENKIFLHFPIQLNADVYVPEDVNTRILELLSKKTSIKIIGIDRGEKNLAYYSVISQTTDGKIKVEDCGDLNLGYLEPLDKLGIERQEQRRAWQSISEIKSKRNGYISHAVHKIANLILDHEAIVVFEDLSGGFKRSRMKIEKAPYQQLELALINKLNYFVKKDGQIGQHGHYLSAYQLTEQVGSYKDMGKQTGIIFYTQAEYTSRTCPHCGWRKRIQGLKYKNLEAVKKLFNPKNGVQISFNGKEFVFRYLVIHDRQITKDWDKEIYSNVSRIRWNGKERNYISYEVGQITNELKILLEENYKIDLEQNINKQMQGIDERNFWERLIYLLNLILEIRNTDSKLGRDYIECPHCHFHSDNRFQGFEWNGDANGAYNIARKGLIILKRIKENPEKPELYISKNEWDKAVGDWNGYISKL